MTKVTDEVSELTANGVSFDPTGTTIEPDKTTLDLAMRELDLHVKDMVAHGLSTITTGDPDNIITVNGIDNTKFDVAAFDGFVNGVHFTFPGATSVTPVMDPSETTTAIWLDENGTIQQEAGTVFISEANHQIGFQIGYVFCTAGGGTAITTAVTNATIIDQKVQQQWQIYGVGTLYSGSAAILTNGPGLNELSISAGRAFLANGVQVDVAAAAPISASLVATDGLGGYTIGPPTTTAIPTDQYDDGAGGLVAHTAGFWAYHSVHRSVATGAIFIVRSAAEYATQLEAEDAAANPDIADFTNDTASSVRPIATIVYQEGATSFTTFIDQRPIIGSSRVATAVSNQASDINYDNAGSGLTANQVQAAIDEVDGRLDTLESDVFGTQYGSDTDATESSTTSLTFQSKLTHVIPSAAPTGTYRVTASYMANGSSVNDSFEVEFFVDTVADGDPHLEEPKDAANYIPSTRIFYVSHTTGADTTLEIRYRSVGGAAVSIKRVVLERWRIS